MKGDRRLLSQGDRIAGNLIGSGRSWACRPELVPDPAPPPGGTHLRELDPISAQKKAKIGCNLVHSLIDGCSGLAYSEAMDDENGATRAVLLDRAAAQFAVKDITWIEWVMTDNVFAYRNSEFMKAVTGWLGVQQRVRPTRCSSIVGACNNALLAR